MTFDTGYSLWVANTQCSAGILGLSCAQECAPEWRDWDTGNVCRSKIVLRALLERWEGEQRPLTQRVFRSEGCTTGILSSGMLVKWCVVGLVREEGRIRLRSE